MSEKIAGIAYNLFIYETICIYHMKIKLVYCSIKNLTNTNKELNSYKKNWNKRKKIKVFMLLIQCMIYNSLRTLKKEIKMENVMVINGEEYVKKEKMEVNNGLEYVLIRTYSAGVHVGYLDKRDGKEVTLVNSRRIWYWDGAASLSQLALEGVSKPENCKFSVVVPKIILTEAIEIINITQKAKKIIEEVPEWKK